MTFAASGLKNFANLYNKQIKKISFNEWSNDKNPVVSYLLTFENLESLSFTVRKDFYYNRNKIKSLAQNLKKLKLLKIFAFKVSFSFESLTVFNYLEDFVLKFEEFEDQNMKFIEKLDLSKLHINFCSF
jgi:hypothetical protein